MERHGALRASGSDDPRRGARCCCCVAPGSADPVATAIASASLRHSSCRCAPPPSPASSASVPVSGVRVRGCAWCGCAAACDSALAPAPVLWARAAPDPLPKRNQPSGQLWLSSARSSLRLPLPWPWPLPLMVHGRVHRRLRDESIWRRPSSLFLPRPSRSVPINAHGANFSPQARLIMTGQAAGRRNRRSCEGRSGPMQLRRIACVADCKGKGCDRLEFECQWTHIRLSPSH